jgi:hypothetical protein
MKPLRLNVPLGTEETPASYCSRLAAANGSTARDFCLDFGIKFQAVVDGNVRALDTVAELGRLGSDRLASHSFRRVQDRLYEHRGQLLTRSSLIRDRVRVCPACLVEDIASGQGIEPTLAVTFRASWLIHAIKTCTTHGLRLMCIARANTPGAMHDFAANVAGAVRRLRLILSTAETSMPTKLETYVLDRLAGKSGPPFLDQLPLYAAIRSSEMIGAVSVFGRTANLKRLTDVEWGLAGADGFAILAGGRPTIDGFLSDLQATYPYSRSSNDGPQALFGRFYQFLAFGAEDAAYDLFRDIVAEHVFANQPVGPGEMVLGRAVVERRLHSIFTLSKQSTLHHKRLRKVLRAAGVITESDLCRPNHQVVFSAKAGEQAVLGEPGALSLVAAGKHLNAPRTHIENLARQGLIHPARPTVRFSAYDRYAAADLDRFLLALLEQARDGEVRPSAADIPHAAKRACCSAMEIVKLILDGAPIWIGRNARRRGYMSVLVDVDEIRAAVRLPDHGGLSLRQAATRLSTTDGVVQRLIDGGYLRVRTATNPVNRCPEKVIDPAEVDQFRAKYISLHLLARARRAHLPHVARDLARAGITPAIQRSAVGATFYFLSDLAPLGVAA